MVAISRARWLTDRSPSGDVHVVPIGDLIVHGERECMCGPTIEAVFRDDGSNGWLVTHHSLDGREQNE